MRHSVFVSITSLLILAAVIFTSVFLLSTRPFFSVEFNSAEVSPLGLAGGYAMPASGESTPPTVTLEVRNATDGGTWSGSDITVDFGDETELQWSSTDATSCTETAGSGFTTGGATGGTDTSISEPNPGSSATYSVSCTGDGGSASDSLMITVNDNAPPSVTLEVQNVTDGGSWTGSNLTIDAGDQVSLKWDSTYTTTCSGVNFSTGGSVDGTQTSVTEPSLGNTTQYTVSCVGGGGTAYDLLSVTVTGEGPEITCTPSIIHSGNSAECVWDANDADPASCSVTGPGVNESPLTTATGSETVTITNESTYAIDCGAGGTDEVTIQVLPEIQET